MAAVARVGKRTETLGDQVRRTENTTKEDMIKRLIIALFAAAVLSFVSTGCHTAHGAGEDISNAGQTIQNNTPP
jgi:predicted small secreted protein